MFEFFRENNCLFVLFFTKDKVDPIHHTYKLMEVEFGITTQHVTAPTMNKAIGDRGAFMVIDNLMLKVGSYMLFLDKYVNQKKELLHKWW